MVLAITHDTYRGNSFANSSWVNSGTLDKIRTRLNYYYITANVGQKNCWSKKFGQEKFWSKKIGQKTFGQKKLVKRNFSLKNIFG